MNSLKDLAVIIPVGPKESAWRALLPDLASLPSTAEVILVGTTSESKAFASTVVRLKLKQNIKWVKAPKGRARQLNFGVTSTEQKLLWFLHADSRVEKEAIEALASSLKQSEEALHYFDLLFLGDGPGLTRINTIGVWIRSHWMGLPFGDQGFCIPRHLFEQLGGFDEKAPYGEDHLLVWAAHQGGVPLRCTGASIRTSARRYCETGWSRATARNMILTAKQALPELGKLLRKRAAYAKP